MNYILAIVLTIISGIGANLAYKYGFITTTSGIWLAGHFGGLIVMACFNYKKKR